MSDEDSSRFDSPHRPWHPVIDRKPFGVDAGGLFCEDCGEYL